MQTQLLTLDPPAESLSAQNSAVVSTPIFPENIEQIPDKDLLTLCRQYGYQARTWRDKFIGLLGEVYKRRLYEKEGFSSIYHFAAVLGGVSQRQVDLAINADRRLEKTPKVKKLYNEGLVSLGKIERVLPILDIKNEDKIYDLIQVSSKRVLAAIARGEKSLKNAANKTEEPLPNSLFDSSVTPGRKKLNFNLSDEVIDELNRLNEQRLDANLILQKLLNQRKEQLKQKVEEESTRVRGETHLPSKRYENKTTRNLLHEIYGDKCAVNGCTHKATETHHKVPFGLQSLNDPAFMVPLCAEHHKIAHTIDLKFASHLHSAQEKTHQTTPRSRDPYEGFSTLD
ncbi:MAG: hypothetical protein WC846_04205 [Candidatus Gracilibacteria bacterium]